MVRPILTIGFIALFLTACDWGKGADVLVDTKVTTVAKTTQCTVPNDDGVRCDRKTCKKDQKSDCRDFGDRCVQYGHTYEGDNDSGECIRQAGIENTG